MGKVFIEEQNLTAIGDAIREKTGKTDLLNPVAMPEEIKGITTGSTQQGMLVRRQANTAYRPKAVYHATSSTAAGNAYPSTSSSQSCWYWYRQSNTNVYWNIASWEPSNFTEGDQYRISFWIWHDGAVNDEPIKIWQDKVFINNNTQASMPITEVRRDPQIVSVTVTYVKDSAYGFSLYIYPEDSGNQVRVTPVVIENMTNPATSTAELPL